jgi:hypothetical protein
MDMYLQKVRNLKNCVKKKLFGWHLEGQCRDMDPRIQGSKTQQLSEGR